MASNSRRKSASSGRSSRRARIEIGAGSGVDSGDPRRSTPRKVPPSTRAAASGSKRGSQAQRVSLAKRQQREKRQRVGRIKGVLILSAAAAVLAGVAWMGFLFVQGPTFRINTVTVEGLSHLTREDAVRLAAIPPGATQPSLPKREIERRIEAEPWVASARVRRRLPDAIVIQIEERRPGAVVDIGGTDLWVVSVDGYWLGERSVAETQALSVRDVVDVVPVRGERVESETVLNAVRVATGLSDELRSITRVISAPSVERTALILEDEVEIFIGDSDDLALKDRIAREILSKQKGRVVYINVRVVSSPTWRGLDQ